MSNLIVYDAHHVYLGVRACPVLHFVFFRLFMKLITGFFFLVHWVKCNSIVASEGNIRKCHPSKKKKPTVNLALPQSTMFSPIDKWESFHELQSAYHNCTEFPRIIISSKYHFDFLCSLPCHFHQNNNILIMIIV